MIARRFLITIVWIELFLVAVLGFFCVLSVFLLTAPFDRRRIWTGRTLRAQSAAAARLSPMWQFCLYGDLPKTKPRRTVCVSNHCSHTDAFLICYLPWEMKWLAKRSLFVQLPFIGWGMWLAGDVPIERASSENAKLALARCARWLERDVPVMIFPEGTRSETGEMLPFKDGAFRLAIETGADVLPLAVAGTETALPKHGAVPGYARGLLAVGTPISTKGMTLSDLPRLKETARQQITMLRAQILPLAKHPKAAG